MGFSKSTVVQWNKDIFAKVPELLGLFEILRTASKGILFNKQDVKWMLPTILELPSLSGYDIYIQLLSILNELATCKHITLSETDFLDDKSTEYGSRIAKVHSFMEANYQPKIYLKELADLVNMTEQSFSQYFSKTMGRPFFTFLNEYRINMASRLLIDTDLTVAEIGFSTGYESLPFFHKQFTKFKKVSPSKFRKKRK